MFVIKADGTKEKFDKNKIIRTCKRAGVSKEVAKKIANLISKKAYNGISTHEIYKMILTELDKRKDKSSFVYRIREAIANLDPVSFELYAKKVLEAHGYKCKWNLKIQGESIDHQVDIVASLQNKFFYVECKRHSNPHRFTDLGVCLETQARLEDMRNGFKKGKNKYYFDSAWIFTNTKFSEHAKKYSKAKSIRLTGWKYQGDFSLEKMVLSKKIFPITILRTKDEVFKRLLEKKIITISDLLEIPNKKLKEITGLTEEGVKDILNRAKLLLQNSS